MNITRPHVDGFRDDQIDQSHNRSTFLRLLSFVLRRFCFRKVNRSLGKLHQHRIDRFRFRTAIEPVDRGLNRFFRCDHGVDLAVDHEPQLIDDIEIEGITHRDAESFVHESDWNHNVLTCDRLWDQSDHALRDFHRFKIDELVSILRRLELTEFTG